MGTAEILIVFSALMALIALVTIGIDWIGKPLKHRRFIPRMYRFDDEKLPIDEYGNTTFDALDGGQYAHAPQHLAPIAYAQPGPQQQMQVQVPGYTPVQPDTAETSDDRANATVVVPVQAPPRQVAKLDPALAASSTASRSAFTDSLAQDDAGSFDQSLVADESDLAAHSMIAGTGATIEPPSSSGRAWESGMALDMTVDDQKPSLAVKAERFWIATADANADSHFDEDDLTRMAEGKAPRRTNPRTGKTEAMQLTGLRQASATSDVRMRWPDDAVDPWSAS